jgi:leader peptidase (prepilin peptidase)/N-methyltransferase
MKVELVIPVLLGWLAGLLVNYLADVLPATRRLSGPRCLHCQTPLSWRDYLTLRACRQCGRRRTLRTWTVQLLAAASFTYFWLFPRSGLGLPLSLIVLTYFGVIIVIDIEHRLILHSTSAFGAVLGLIAGTYTFGKENGLLTGALTSLAGGVAGFLIMFVFYKLGEVVARYRASKMRAAGQAEDDEEALGGGDVFLSGVLGLMLGWPHILLGLTAGALIGGVGSLLIVLLYSIQKRYRQNSLTIFVPYGPFLVLGTFYVLYFL